MKPLGKKIKNAKNWEFFDISYNLFNADPIACILLCQSMRGCDKI